MASVKKFKQTAVVQQIRHVERTVKSPSNTSIDPTLTPLNYILSPLRGISSYDYYKQRISNLYVFNRDDVITLAGWIVTLPGSLPVEQESAFFKATYDFLVSKYKEENVILAAVHKDEAGQPHLHFLFIPVIFDIKRNREKVCAAEVLTRSELRNFHPALQLFLNSRGIAAQVQNGVTMAVGGNRSVSVIKKREKNIFERTW